MLSLRQTSDRARFSGNKTMHHLLNITYKIFRILLRTAGIILLFFVLVAGLIQLPYIQNKIVGIATSYISQKVQSRVEIGNIGISFPKYIVIKSLLVEDQQKDTLLYAGKLKVDYQWKDFFNQRINLNDLVLQDVDAHVYNRDSVFNYEFLIDAFADTTQLVRDTTSSAPWLLYAGNIRLENIRLRYEDIPHELQASLLLNYLDVESLQMDFARTVISVKKVDIRKNALEYRSGTPTASDHKTFDPAHIALKDMDILLENISYSPEQIKLTLAKFNATDSNGFSIRSLKTTFELNSNRMALHQLEMATGHSSMKADIALSYPSLQSIGDSLPALYADIRIDRAVFGNEDILYFSPDLSSIDFFRQKRLSTSVSGTITGQIDDLYGDDLRVATAGQTRLESSFHITGLPDIAKTHFDFPGTILQTNRKDLMLIAGSMIPKEIDIPEKMLLNIDFYGKTDRFQTSAGLLTDLGNLILTAELDQKEKYSIRLDMREVNLGRILKNEKRFGQLSLIAEAHGQGFNMQELRADIRDLSMTGTEPEIQLDSLVLTAINQPGNSQWNIRSSLLDMDYAGNLAPMELPDILAAYVQQYTGMASDESKKSSGKQPASFDFSLLLKNHPLISEYLLPDLHEFDPGKIYGNFDESTQTFHLHAGIGKIIYAENEVSDLSLDINSEKDSLIYQLNTSGKTGDQFLFKDILLNGSMSANSLTANLLGPGENGKRLLLLEARMLRKADNIEIKTGQTDLNHISIFLMQDSSLLKGTLNGHFLLKKVADSYGLIADADIRNLQIQNLPVGDITLKADNPSGNRFDINMSLTGNGNAMTAAGYFMPADTINSIFINAKIDALPLKTVEAFSLGQVRDATGILTGNILVKGNPSKPFIDGQINFNDVSMLPSYLNSHITLKHEKIRLTNDTIYLDNFTMRDTGGNAAIINGTVQMKDFSDFKLNLDVNSRDFMLFNTTAKDNDLFYGRMIIDSDIRIRGPLSLPVIDARLKMKPGSRFSFILPEEQLTTYKGEDVVEFISGDDPGPETDSIPTITSTFTGFDLSSVIEIDKAATLRLFMDPASSDSLVVKGDAALSLTMDRSGKMSLTGAYQLQEGSYLISLESLIKKKFEIISGSTIIWNGDPTDANISIDAAYNIRTAPYNLVAEQIAGMTDAEQAGYKQQYLFIVVLKMRGELMQPEISFEIRLRPEDEGILGGAMQQKLNQLNEDPSALNKQVFALLALGRFVQENPLSTESSSASALVRSTVSSFLSDQLNKLGSNFIPGLQMNVDVRSFEDTRSGAAEGRTQVDLGVKKEFFNERLSIEIGGTVDVEGEKASQNSLKNIAGEVTIEYKLTEDGRYRLRGFRHETYDGVIEGELTETGAGIIYVKDFNSWKEVFKKAKAAKE